MTTQALSASESATSYAAALASGSSKSIASKAEVSTVTLGTMALANGVSEPASIASAPRANDSHTKVISAISSPAPELSRGSTPSLGGLSAKYDDDVAAAAAVNDEKSNGWEGNSQASSHPDSKSSGADTARATDFVTVVHPTVNVWKKRQEEMTAKKGVSPPTLVSVAPAAASKSSSPDKGAGKKDEKKDVESKEQKKGSSDEVPTKRGSRRGQSNENEASVALPPPVTDTTSWPTPDLAQGEIKKDKDETLREKPAPAARGGNKTWVPVAIDPPYVPPIQTKSGRGGRGSRGGREGGRGTAAGAGGDRPERATGAGQGASGVAEGERGRQYTNPRGGYQGKGAKRTSSTSGTAQRRDSKAGVNGPGERRKEGADPNWSSEANTSGTASTATQTERPRPARTAEESSYAGETRHCPEGQEKSASSHNYGGRLERSAQWYPGSNRPDPDSPSTYTPRERGSERSRGGYRGRGNYHGQFSNGHHSAGFQAQPATPPFAAQNANGHQYAQHSHPRGGSFRGRGHSAYSTHPYRFGPAMQTPQPQQFPYAAPSTPYDYSLLPGVPAVDFGALINQMNYYFSVDNLCKDMYLRKRMDNDGYVRLSFLMTFHRVLMHTKDINVLRDACLESQEIQLTYGKDDYYVRKKQGWENWVLKESDRDDSAKRGMSDWHFDPRQRQHSGNTQTPPGEMSGSAEPFFPGTSGAMAPAFYQPTNTSYSYPAPTSTSTLSAAVPEFSPSSQHALQDDGKFNSSVPFRATDECTDAEVDTLIVVVKRPSTGDNTPASPETSSNRQPNGVTDSATISERLSNGDGAFDESSKTSQSNGYVADAGMSHRSYSEVRAQAIKQRETGGQAKNNDLITLYKFWSHFLVKRFNGNMYREFKQFAMQDADGSVRAGVEEIFRLYERSFRDRDTIGYEIIRDFVELVRTEVRHGETLGIDKLKSVLTNPSLKDDFKSAIESLVDDNLRGAMGTTATAPAVRRTGRSPASEPYKASAMAS